MTNTNPADLCARRTDAILGGERPLLDPPADSDQAVAARLLRHAEGMPDPYFAESLRADLLARARQSTTFVHYAPMETPVGRILVAYRDGAVVSTTGWREPAAFERELALTLGTRTEADPAPPESLRAAVIDHLEGRARFENVDLSWLRPFQRRVLEQTAQIPRGEVRPYGWIAREIGSPGATRAVGTALGHNPIPFIIPCHRVVRSDGRLGEYSGGGPEAKVRWLAYEGVAVDTVGGRVALSA